MTVKETIMARRSIRNYKPDEVDEVLLNQVLEAGKLAPSALNKQNWKCTVVKNKDIAIALSEACLGQKMVKEAPVTLVLWSTDDRVMHCGQSAASINCSIALSFMLLEAAALGLGTCWLGAYDNEKVKKVLNLPQKAQVVAVSPLGYSDEKPMARPRKDLSELIEIIA